VSGPARKGQRVALATRSEAAMTATYVCGARPLDFGELVLTEGVEVPGAGDWPRIEAWVSARRVRPLRVDEQYTRFEDFKADWDLEHPAVEETEQAAEGTEREE
jgi:hypothetical protein